MEYNKSRFSVIKKKNLTVEYLCFAFRPSLPLSPLQFIDNGFHLKVCSQSMNTLLNNFHADKLAVL